MGGANTSNMIFSMGAPVSVGLPLGVGTGEVFHLCASTSDYYYDALKRRGIPRGRIFTDLTTAYGQMVSNRGDTLIVYPGDHVQTASLTWAKNNTAIVGAGGPNQRYQPSTLTAGGVRLTCTTAAVNQILDITGHYVSMFNIGTFNSANNANNLSDLQITGKNFYAYGCSFRGGNGAAQVGANGAGVPLIFNSNLSGGGGANAAWLDRCTIGSSGNTDRTKGPGCVSFLGGNGGGFGVKFTNCDFSTRISTANADDACMILLADPTNSVDRELFFNNCLFYNFVENLASKLDYCFHDDCTTTHSITLLNCANVGIDNWTNATTYLNVCSAAGALLGGVGVNS